MSGSLPPAVRESPLKKKAAPHWSPGWLPVMGVVLPEEQIRRVLKEAEQVLAPYVTPEGTVAFDSPAHIVTGTKP